MPKTLIQRARRVPPAEKAAFHQIEGAGRSKVKRQFMGLSDRDADDIVERVGRHLDRLIRTGRP